MPSLPTQEEFGHINVDARVIVNTLKNMLFRICWLVVLTCDLISLVPRQILDNQKSVPKEDKPHPGQNLTGKDLDEIKAIVLKYHADN